MVNYQALIHIEGKVPVGVDVVVDERRERPEILRGHGRQPSGGREDLLEDPRFDPPLQPRDIAVLAPDIDPYLPYVEAVFGVPDQIPKSSAGSPR